MKDLRDSNYLSFYFKQFPDNHILKRVINFFNGFPDKSTNLEKIIGKILRNSLDEVIDMPRTGRFSLEECEKTEKTYIGTKVEILFRDTFSLPKGKKLDLLIDDLEVDIKNTVLTNWTIPIEAHNEICILLQSNDNKSLFSFGVVICKEHILNSGKNRDGKRTISKFGKKEIFWILKEANLPKNFFLHMNSVIRQDILSPSGGSQRLANLFRNFQGEVIPRKLVECVARQKDYMKRLRGNGGARDILKEENLFILWGGNKKDQEILKGQNYFDVNSEQFVCLKIQI